MKPIHSAIVTVALLLAASGATLTAQDISPNLATTVPGSFYTDRFAPTVFQLANGVYGRNNVLLLQAGTDAASRPAGQQGRFYNTQGKKTDVNTAGSWLFQSDLYLESSWADQTQGYVRTDIWGTATDDALFLNPSAYPIIGFTNYEGSARFRGWNMNTSSFIDFAGPVPFGAWTTLGMGFNVVTNTFSYYVNGALSASVLAATTSTGVANVMYQSYNFNEPSLNVTNNPNATVNWSNTPAESVVPEPSTYALMAFGLAGLFFVRRKHSARNAK